MLMVLPPSIEDASGSVAVQPGTTGDPRLDAKAASSWGYQTQSILALLDRNSDNGWFILGSARTSMGEYIQLRPINIATPWPSYDVLRDVHFDTRFIPLSGKDVNHIYASRQTWEMEERAMT